MKMNEFERKSYILNGGKILVFGDLHFSSTYEGKHKNYMLDCYTNMDIILDHVKREKPKAVFLTGDLIGVNERNIRDRQFLMRVVMFFGTLYNITKGNVYSVKGNHDMGDFSDFDFLIGLGYIKNPIYVDYKGDDNLEVRFHFVNYGDEHKQLQIADNGASNIVLGHADYYIEGVTTWYSSTKGSVELKRLSNFCGVDLVFAGHIHTPSEEMFYTNLPNSESIGVFYVGSPSRTAERFEDCWYVVFEYNQENACTNYDARLMGLPSIADTFYEDSQFIGDNAEEIEPTDLEKRTQALDFIVQEVLNSRIVSGDLFKQIDIIPADDEVKDLAKKYLRIAIEEVK